MEKEREREREWERTTRRNIGKGGEFLLASLASSAFLIYLDPQHETNRARTLVLGQIGAASLGLLAYLVLGSGYAAAGTAMVATSS